MSKEYNPLAHSKLIKFADTEPNTEVKVSYDPSIIDKNKDWHNEKSNNNSMQTAHQRSAIAKDERKFKLQHGIENGTIKTMTEARAVLEVSDKTIKKYLKELNMSFKKDM